MNPNVCTLTVTSCGCFQRAHSLSCMFIIRLMAKWSIVTFAMHSGRNLLVCKYPRGTQININQLQKLLISSLCTPVHRIRPFRHDREDQREEKWGKRGKWNQNRAFWYQLDLPCMEEEKCWGWPKESHLHSQECRWKDYTLRCCRAKDTGQLHRIERAMNRSCPVKSWTRTFFHRPEYWRWMDRDGSSSMTVTQNIPQRQQWRG